MLIPLDPLARLLLVRFSENTDIVNAFNEEFKTISPDVDFSNTPLHVHNPDNLVHRELSDHIRFLFFNQDFPGIEWIEIDLSGTMQYSGYPMVDDPLYTDFLTDPLFWQRRFHDGVLYSSEHGWICGLFASRLIEFISL